MDSDHGSALQVLPWLAGGLAGAVFSYVLLMIFKRRSAPRRQRHGSKQYDFGQKRGRLEHALSRQIHYYKTGAFSNRRTTSRFKWAITVLTLTTTILLGLEIKGGETMFKQVAFVISAVVTAISSLESFHGYRQGWLTSQGVYFQLIQLKANYLFEVSNPMATSEDDIVQKYWDELQRILTAAYEQRIKALDDSTSPADEN